MPVSTLDKAAESLNRDLDTGCLIGFYTPRVMETDVVDFKGLRKLAGSFHVTKEGTTISDGTVSLGNESFSGESVLAILRPLADKLITLGRFAQIGNHHDVDGF